MPADFESQQRGGEELLAIRMQIASRQTQSTARRYAGPCRALANPNCSMGIDYGAGVASSSMGKSWARSPTPSASLQLSTTLPQDTR